MRFRVHGLVVGVWTALLGATLGCVHKPIQLRVVDCATGAPVEGADVRQHGAQLFAFFPSTALAPKTNAEGEVALVLNARGTSLAVLRPGYIPIQVAIVPEPSGGAHHPSPQLAVCEISASNCVEFEQIAPKATIEVRLTPTVPRLVRICVQSEEALPLAGVEVISHAGLFLPKDGVEAQWGLPPIQRAITSADGCVEVTVHGGLRNYLYVRAAGRETERRALDGFDASAQIAVTLRAAEFKSAVFRVVNEATGRPVKNATVEFGKELDGIGRDPNGWSVQTDSSGCTPVVQLPDCTNLIVTGSCERFRSSRKVIAWRFVRVGHPLEILLERK